MSGAGKRGFYGNRKVGGRSLLGTEREKSMRRRRREEARGRGPWVGGSRKKCKIEIRLLRISQKRSFSYEVEYQNGKRS